MILKDMKDSLSILLASLTAIFSILYSMNIEAFNRENSQLIIIFEVYSATFAFCIYIIDRLGALKVKSKSCGALINTITASFFLITIPHLLADSIEKLCGHYIALILSLFSPIIILFFCSSFLLKELKDYNIKKAILCSLLSTSVIVLLLGTMLYLTYGGIIISH